MSLIPIGKPQQCYSYRGGILGVIEAYDRDREDYIRQLEAENHHLRKLLMEMGATMYQRADEQSVLLVKAALAGINLARGNNGVITG